MRGVIEISLVPLRHSFKIGKEIKADTYRAEFHEVRYHFFSKFEISPSTSRSAR